jgi:hypothetical protein
METKVVSCSKSPPVVYILSQINAVGYTLFQISFNPLKVKQSLYTPWRRLRGEEV